MSAVLLFAFISFRSCHCFNTMSVVGIYPNKASLTFCALGSLPGQEWPHSSLPQGSLHTMSLEATEHSTSFQCPQGSACFRTICVHLNSEGSKEQGTSCSCSHPGMTFVTLTLQGPHSSLQILGQLCPRSQLLVHGFGQANSSLCPRSIG